MLALPPKASPAQTSKSEIPWWKVCIITSGFLTSFLFHVDCGPADPWFHRKWTFTYIITFHFLNPTQHDDGAKEVTFAVAPAVAIRVITLLIITAHIYCFDCNRPPSSDSFALYQKLLTPMRTQRKRRNSVKFCKNEICNSVHPKSDLFSQFGWLQRDDFQ
jgi:hypothetical protein